MALDVKSYFREDKEEQNVEKTKMIFDIFSEIQKVLPDGSLVRGKKISEVLSDPDLFFMCLGVYHRVNLVVPKDSKNTPCRKTEAQALLEIIMNVQHKLSASKDNRVVMLTQVMDINLPSLMHLKENLNFIRIHKKSVFSKINGDSIKLYPVLYLANLPKNKFEIILDLLGDYLLNLVGYQAEEFGKISMENLQKLQRIFCTSKLNLSPSQVIEMSDMDVDVLDCFSALGKNLKHLTEEHLELLKYFKPDHLRLLFSFGNSFLFQNCSQFFSIGCKIKYWAKLPRFHFQFLYKNFGDDISQMSNVLVKNLADFSQSTFKILVQHWGENLLKADPDVVSLLSQFPSNRVDQALTALGEVSFEMDKNQMYICVYNMMPKKMEEGANHKIKILIEYLGDKISKISSNVLKIFTSIENERLELLLKALGDSVLDLKSNGFVEEAFIESFVKISDFHANILVQNLGEKIQNMPGHRITGFGRLDEFRAQALIANFGENIIEMNYEEMEKFDPNFSKEKNKDIGIASSLLS